MSVLWVRKATRPHYLLDQGVCVLPVSHVLAGNPSALAFTLIHEATHARVAKAGIEWRPSVESRIEHLCLKEEERFALHLERRGFDVDAIRAWIERARTTVVEHWDTNG